MLLPVRISAEYIGYDVLVFIVLDQNAMYGLAYFVGNFMIDATILWRRFSYTFSSFSFTFIYFSWVFYRSSSIFFRH